LKEISRKDLNGLENLVGLCLGNNELTSLPEDLFVNMKNLKMVSFFNNKLEFIDSKMLKPLKKNQMKSVNFSENTNINAFYESGNSDSVASLEELMRIIDEKCKKPTRHAKSSHEEEFDEFKNNFLAELWANGKFSDFVIIADGPKEFHVHKTVLGLRSSAFNEMFENNFDQKELKIENLEADSVKFLRFIYTGKMSEKFNTKEVFALAAKFKVELRVEKRMREEDFRRA
jgi:hypothetical protein